MRDWTLNSIPRPVALPALALAFPAGCEAQDTMVANTPIPHPLDPLTADEYGQTIALLRAAGHLNDASRFSSLDLHEPAKASVLAWRPGQDFDRSAFAIVKQGSQTFEAVVDLSNESVVSWTEIEGVQPSLLIEELLGVGETLAGNEEHVAALAVRGFSPDEVLCAPMTLGNYDIPAHRGRRLLSRASSRPRSRTTRRGPDTAASAGCTIRR